MNGFKTTLAVVAVAGAALLAACGGDDAGTTTAAEAGDQMIGMNGSTASMNDGSMPQMIELGKASTGDESVELVAMPPETFFVSQGTGLSEHRPGSADDAHMMAMVSDKDSGIRLPGATVTLRVQGPDGKTTFDGPLYEMIGKGMGLHYGENVALGKPGDYTAELVVGPPTVGRHQSVAGSWEQTARLSETFSWDGHTVEPAS